LFKFNSHPTYTRRSASDKAENKGEAMKNRWIAIAFSGCLLALWVLGLFLPGSTVQATAPALQKTLVPERPTLAARATEIQATLAARPTQDFTYLENFLVREKLVLSNQQTRLELAHKTDADFQKYIDSQKSAGKDTATLESALKAFHQALSSTESDHSAAGKLLASPAGFDGNGHVTDNTVARKTLQDAGQSLRKAHLTLTSGTLALRQALQTYQGR
jgi:hypothetical protein